jgi:hypothetical protein
LKSLPRQRPVSILDPETDLESAEPLTTAERGGGMGRTAVKQSLAALIAIVAFGLGGLVFMTPSAQAQDGAANHERVTADSVGVLAGYELTSADSDAAGKCVDVYDWGNGPWIQMWQCHGGANQDWTIQWVTNETVVLVNHASGQCIDGAWGHWEQLRQWTCDQTGTQEFFVWDTGSTYVFESAYIPGQCIDIRDSGLSHVVMLWDCHFDSNQQWYY